MVGLQKKISNIKLHPGQKLPKINCAKLLKKSENNCEPVLMQTFCISDKDCRANYKLNEINNSTKKSGEKIQQPFFSGTVKINCCH